jgi:ElaB/YqjD/DUF883 family membrane-anchored ribosome-binding protein
LPSSVTAGPSGVPGRAAPVERVVRCAVEAYRSGDKNGRVYVSRKQSIIRVLGRVASDMVNLREELDSANEQFQRAIDHAGDELKSGVQSASSKLSRLIDDLENDVEGAGDRAGEVADDLIRDVDDLLERADEETTEHLENARNRLRGVRDEER